MGPATIAAASPSLQSLTPPAFKWGSAGVNTPAPAQLIGYDSGTGQACIVGSTATCLLPSTLGTPAVSRSSIHAGNFAVPGDYDPLCLGNSSVHDCSTALATAAAVTANGINVDLYLQAGNYYTTGPIACTNGQTIYGDGKGQTTILVDQSFSPAAAGVINMTSANDSACQIHDLDIEFAQPSDQGTRSNFAVLGSCTSATGGTGCKYPPAINAVSASARYKVQNVRIARAWDGINSNGVNAVWWIDDVEMSALNIGLNMAGTKDFSHIHGFHFWNFDINAATALYTGVFTDGNTFAAQFGEMDGLNVVDFTDFHGRISINSASFWGQFSNLMLDSNNATLEIAATNWLQINGIYATGASSGANSHCQIDVSGGTTIINNIRTTSSQSSVCQTAGTLIVSTGQMVPTTTATAAATISGGNASFRDIAFQPNTGAGMWTVPVVAVTISATIKFQANTFNTTPGDVGGLSITTDSATNFVNGNNFNGWGFTPPGTSGNYDNNSGGMLSATTTTAPTQAAGHLTLGGATGSPTLGADGEGFISLTTGGGLHLWGRGTTNDLVLLNKSGGTIAVVPTGTTNFQIAGAGEIGSASGGFKAGGSLNISGIYWSNGTQGLTCSGTPSASFASTNGIVTHC